MNRLNTIYKCGGELRVRPGVNRINKKDRIIVKCIKRKTKYYFMVYIKKERLYFSTYQELVFFITKTLNNENEMVLEGATNALIGKLIKIIGLVGIKETINKEESYLKTLSEVNYSDSFKDVNNCEHYNLPPYKPMLFLRLENDHDYHKPRNHIMVACLECGDITLEYPYDNTDYLIGYEKKLSDELEDLMAFEKILIISSKYKELKKEGLDINEIMNELKEMYESGVKVYTKK